MKLKFIYFLASCLLVLYVLQSNSSGVGAVQGLDRTGSPIAGGLNCGLCHGGAFNNAAMVITVRDASSQIVTDYVPGDVYTVAFAVSNQFGFTHGMQAVALTGGNTQAGNFFSPGANTKITPISGRQYVEHTNAVIHPSLVTFSSSWTAPVTGTGNVTIYAAGVVGGGSGTNSSDPIAPLNLVLTERVVPAIDYAQNSYCQNDFDPTPTQQGPSGGTYTATPSGLLLNANTGTVDLNLSAVGTYTVTYTYSTGSVNDQITITAADDASFSFSSNTYCVNQNDPIPTVTGLGGGYFLGGSGVVIDSTTGTIDLSASGVGTFTVGYFTNGPCPAQTFLNIDITNAIDASFTYSSSSYCQNDNDPIPTPVTTGGSYSSSPSGLVLSTSTGQIDLSASTVGNYTITYTTGGTCSNSSTQAVSVAAPDNATFLYSSASYCQNASDPTPTITGIAGGQFSSTTGLIIAPSSGLIDVSASTPGTYTVTYTTNGSCPNSRDEVVTINALDDAGFTYASPTYCQNGNDPLPTITGVGNGVFTSGSGLVINATTGIIDLSSSTAGTYMVTYTTTGQCANSSMRSVTIDAADDASFTYNVTRYCLNGNDPTPTITGLSGGTFSGAAGLSLDVNTGRIDVSASTVGNYVVTYTTAGNCPNSATFAVSIDALDNAAFAYSNNAYCQNQSGGNPQPTVTGVAGGTFSSTAGLSLVAATGALNLSASTPGTYTVTYTTNGNCSNSSTRSVTVRPPDNATFSYSASAYCQGPGANPSPTVTGITGGQFSSGSGLVINANTGVINRNASTAGTYTVTYTTNGNCPNTATQSVTINALDDATFTYANTTYCQSAANPTPTVSGLAGGTFNSTAGLVINANTGTINLANSTAGTYTVTYSTNGTCANASTRVVTVTGLDNASFGYNNSSYCQTATDPTPTITGLAGGQFSSSNGLSINPNTGQIDVSASTAGTYTVTYTTNGNCPNTATRTVIIEAPSNASFAYSNNSYCRSSPNPTPTITGVSGGTFSSTTGLVINASTGAINLANSTPGTYTVTYSVTSNCSNASTQVVTVTNLDNANFAYTASTYCQSGADPTPTITGASGGTFASTAGLSLNPVTGAIDLSASSIGIYTVTYTTNSNCSNSSTQSISIVAPSNAAFAYANSSYCQSATNPTPTITGVSGGTFSSTNGLTINATTGTVDLANSTAGTYTITYSITNNCPNSSTQTLTVSPIDNANFSYGQNGYCQTDNDPTPTITGVSGGTFASTAGLSLNPVTGTIDVSASTAGTYTVTYTTNGNCPGSESRTVVINAAGVTSFAYANSTYCQSFPNPTPTITGSQGGTFSSSTGLVLNANTGQVDLVNSTAGTYTITYTVSGTCGSISTQSIGIVPVEDASFSYNNNSYCQTSTDPTPNITGLSGGTFASTAGLSLNPVTGTIDVSASTAGTYTVTYTTNGNCPGSESRTVIINATTTANFTYSTTSYCQSANQSYPYHNGQPQEGAFSSTEGLIINASTGQIDLANSTAGTYTSHLHSIGHLWK